MTWQQRLKNTLSYMQIAILCLALTRCTHENIPTKIPIKRGTSKPYLIKNGQGIYWVKPSQYINLNEEGIASYYGKDFHGKRTAMGTTFNMHAYTAAHKTAHLPSVALITHNGKSRVILINDRGPFAKNRMIDCSQKLATDLGFSRQGHAKVHIKVLKHETLALKENGGHISWDGSTQFPLTTPNTKNHLHHIPTKIVAKIHQSKSNPNKHFTVKISTFKKRKPLHVKKTSAETKIGKKKQHKKKKI